MAGDAGRMEDRTEDRTEDWAEERTEDFLRRLGEMRDGEIVEILHRVAGEIEGRLMRQAGMEEDRASLQAEENSRNYRE